MKTLLATRYIIIRSDVEITIVSRDVTVVGPRGTLNRAFKHRNLEITPVGGATDSKTGKVGNKRLRVDVWFGKKKDTACLRTICSHIENMMTGTTLGFSYRMRAVYAHFPINMVLANNGKVEIRNFLGERRVRVVQPMEGVKVEKATDAKDTLVISGTNVESVGRTCALIGQQALVRRKDIRKFLDGIYIESRGNISADPVDF